MAQSADVVIWNHRIGPSRSKVTSRLFIGKKPSQYAQCLCSYLKRSISHNSTLFLPYNRNPLYVRPSVRKQLLEKKTKQLISYPT